MFQSEELKVWRSWYFPPQVRGCKTPTLQGGLQRANLDWTLHEYASDSPMFITTNVGTTNIAAKMNRYTEVKN
jgi:hypothetical protein